MAVYRLGDMVRMRRNALGMTQEELVQIYDGKETEAQNGVPKGSWLRYHGRRQACDMYRDKNEICSVQVLRRIENGGVKRVKIEVFRRLMMKMGVLPERFYASVMVTECSGFRLKTLIHTHVIRKAYQEAEMELQDHYVVWHAVILADLSQLMCMTGRYDKAAEYCDTGILECRQQRILGDVPYFLFDQAWIRENQLRMGIYPKTESPEQQDDAVKKERAFCRKQLVQGYYLSVAQGDIHGAMRTKNIRILLSGWG